MRNENVPTPESPERPPLAPYDPPAPAPQAAAWRQALKVIGCRPRRAAYAMSDDRAAVVEHPVDQVG
jgi:hypothetical protein